MTQVVANDQLPGTDDGQLIDWPRLFERQVAATPQRLAVVFEDQQLSYDELNQRANRIAHRFFLQPNGCRRVCRRPSVHRELMSGFRRNLTSS